GPLLPDGIFTRATAQQLIQRHMAAHIFMTSDDLARREHPRRSMCTAAQLTYGLDIIEVLQGFVEVTEVEGLGKRQRRDGLTDIVMLFNATRAAAGTSGQRPAALFQPHKATAGEFD